MYRQIDNKYGPITFTDDIDVQEVSAYGGDWLICDAARVSSKHAVGSGPRILTDADKGLIKTLIKQRHGGPFGHGGLTVFVKAPIFVFREWRTHRIYMAQSTDDFSYSESSARYRPLQPIFYVPSLQRPVMKKENHKAMRPEFNPPTNEEYAKLYEQLAYGYQVEWNLYSEMLEDGVAPEIARSVLGTGIYSSMYVSCNPRSLMHFLSLRTHDENAAYVSYPQWEIEVAARIMENIFSQYWPHTYEAFTEFGRMGV
jgi:thymidylate synthase (FAD)